MNQGGDPPDDNAASPDVLMGWKAIATYLGKSVRSVQRWEQDLGLPTHRIRTTEGQIAYAKRSEIDAWMAARDRPPAEITLGDKTSEPADGEGAAPAAEELSPDHHSRRHFWPISVALLVIVFVLVGLALRTSTKGPPAKFLLVGRKFEVRDAQGVVVGSYPFDTEVSRAGNTWEPQDPMSSDSAAHVDLRGDGRMSVLVPVKFAPSDQMSTTSDGLYAFTEDGQMLWKVVPDLTFSCGGRTLSAPWILQTVLVSGGSGPKRVWVSYSHNTYGPSFVIEVSPDGHTQTLRYFQNGWIRSLAEWSTPSGLRLVAAGVMGFYDRPSVTWFDPNGPPVSAPYMDSQFTCAGVPTASPDHVVLFPNPEVTQAEGFPYVMVDRVYVLGPDLRTEINGGNVLGFIAPNGTDTNLVLTDIYWAKHKKLEADHKLTHSAATCPERTNPGDIISWTPTGGWQTRPLPTKPVSGSSKH